MSVDTGRRRASGDAQRQGEQAGERAPLGWLARAGLVARGVVYAIIGVLALKLALGDGGKATNQQGALKTIADQPFGKTLLVARRDRPGRLRAVAAGPRRASATAPEQTRQRLRPRRRAGQRRSPTRSSA